MVYAGKERWQVMWHAIRKLRSHRSIRARIDKGAAGASASMAAMLIFSGRSLARRLSQFRGESENTSHVYACANFHPCPPEKKKETEKSLAHSGVIETPQENRSYRIHIVLIHNGHCFLFLLSRFFLTRNDRPEKAACKKNYALTIKQIFHV